MNVLKITNSMTLKTNLLVCTALILSGCSSKSYKQPIMATPEILTTPHFSPFEDSLTSNGKEKHFFLYATNRQPDSSSKALYTGETGEYVRLGVASVRLTDTLQKEQALNELFASTRSQEYPIQLDRVTEYSYIPESRLPVETASEKPVPLATHKMYANYINEQLARSNRKEITIYMHGYKVGFDNPLLVAAQWWNYLGKDGVFMAYSWPSTPDKALAYFEDLETAAIAVRPFRSLLEYLAKETNAEKINIMVWSAGTRIVFNLLHQEALQKRESPLPLGKVIIIGSDMSESLFAGYVADGITSTVDELTIYQSDSDKALRSSKRIFSGGRVGQKNSLGNPASLNDSILQISSNMHFIDVSAASLYNSGNGHHYFYRSPIVSSDIIAQLRFNLDPLSRGLTQHENHHYWEFPANYIAGLQEKIQILVKE